MDFKSALHGMSHVAIRLTTVFEVFICTDALREKDSLGQIPLLVIPVYVWSNSINLRHLLPWE